jgi:serine racemase
MSATLDFLEVPSMTSQRVMFAMWHPTSLYPVHVTDRLDLYCNWCQPPFSQVPQLDVLVVPVSGGGMISGIAVAAKAVKPSIRIVAAEPCGTNDAADAAASKRQQRLMTDLPKTATIADGLQGG